MSLSVMTCFSFLFGRRKSPRKGSLDVDDGKPETFSTIDNKTSEVSDIHNLCCFNSK